MTESIEPAFEVQLPRAQRMFWLFSVAFLCIYVCSGIIVGFILSITNTSLFDGTAAEAFFFGIIGIFPAVFMLRLARDTGWFGEKYFITPDRIERILRNGKVVSGRWKDLIFTSRNFSFLGFEDGTMIEIPFLLHRLKPEQLEVVLKYAGEESPLTVAHQNYEKFDYGQNKGYRPVLFRIFISALLLAIVPFLAVFKFDAVPHDMEGIAIGVSMSLLAISFIGIMALVIPFLIRTFLWSAADRKEFRRLTGKRAGI